MKIPVSMTGTSPVLVASLILACLPLLAQEQHDPDPPKAVQLTWGVKIPMRDGVKLNATVYRPNDQKSSARDLRADPLHQRQLSRPRLLLCATRLRVFPGRCARARKFRGTVRPLPAGAARWPRCGRVAGHAAVVEWQGRNVGRILRWL